MWTIESWYEEARRSGEERRAYHRQMADFRLTIYERAFPELSREEIGERLLECNRERLDAVPARAGAGPSWHRSGPLAPQFPPHF